MARSTWIKLPTDLAENPRTLAIAERLRLDPAIADAFSALSADSPCIDQIRQDKR